MIERNEQASHSSSDQRWTTTSSKPKQLVKRKRLATLKPMRNPPVKHQQGLESESRLKPRLPVIAPSCEAFEPPIENEQLPSPEEEVVNIKPQPTPRVPRNHSRFKVVALLCSFAMVLGGFIGVFACHVPKSQKSYNTVAETVDPQRPQSLATITDLSATVAPRLQPATASLVTLPLLKEAPVEKVQLEEEVEPVDEVLQLAQEADLEQDVQLAADKTEPQLTDEDEAAALVARVTKLLEKPIGNANDEDASLSDAPPVLEPTAPALEPIAHPVLKKPIKIVGIQKLGADELRAMLQTETASVDLLQSKREFADTKKYIHERETVDMLMGKQIQLRDRASQPGADQRILQKNLLKLQRETTAKANKPLQEHDPVELLSNQLSERKDLQALPLTMGDQCRANVEEATAIKLVSGKLGRLISEASAGAQGVILRNSGNIALRSKMIKARQDKSIEELRDLVNSDSHPQYLKTTDQILQVQHRRDRLELINTLKGADNSTAIELLAKRAKYDLSADVRLAATHALAESPRDQYRAELLAGLAYPWHVVAQHSAEALVRLDDKEAIPELVAMLDLPHPAVPIEVEPDKYVQPTLVAINHMRNCLLCHAPSLSLKDIATAAVPNWDSPIPTSPYESSDPDFVSVRADITYLKQDFSVVQPVVNHGPWPSKQRFDYVVQQTPMKRSKVNRTKKQIAKSKNLNREAIVFALQKLSNLSPEDNSSESWKEILEAQNAARLAQADSR